jgi:hypothetical protein
MAEDRDIVKRFLENLDPSAVKKIINVAETGSKISNNWGNVFNTLGSIVSAISSPVATYNIVWATRNLDFLVDNGLFEEISADQKHIDNITTIIQDYIKSTSTESQERIIELNKLIKDDPSQTEKYNKEKNNLIKEMGFLAYKMIDYRELANSFSNREFLAEILNKKEDTGLLREVYKKYRNWASSKPNTPEINKNYKDFIMSSIDLLTQKHVAKSLLPMVRTELVKQIFDLPALTDQVSAYLPLVKSLAANQNQFQELFGNLIDKTGDKKGIGTLISTIIDYINTPSDNPEINNKFKSVITESVKLLSQKHVAKALLPMAGKSLVDQIFALPSITSQVKAYHEVVKSLAKDDEKFKKLFDDIIAEEVEFPSFMDKMMDFVLQKENDSKISEKYQISLIECLKPNIILSFVDTINTDTIDKILELPAFKKQDNPNPPKSRIERIKSFFTDSLNFKVSTTLNEAINKITQYLTTTKDKAPKTSNIKNALSKMVEELSNSENLDTIKISIKGKEDVFKTLIYSNSEVGEILKAFDIKPEDFTETLSKKILNKKGLNSISQYLEEPTYVNLFNLLRETQTLSFVASHCLSFVKNKMMGTSVKKEDQKTTNATKTNLPLNQEIPSRQ